MKVSDIRIHLNGIMPGLIRRLGLDDWTIGWSVAGKPDNIADVVADYKHKEAEITFDKGSFPTPEKLYRTALHELLHVVASPTDRYADLVEAGLADRPDVLAVLREAREQMDEELLQSLLKTYDSIARDLIRAAD